ncbi:hypothetical protein CAC42_8139 [Sphaceloma murrayae]|uniref:Uncharacterized protein n=1 Tax=Sphaceloma murrayae TaxID=2082308 RepID=A0A2K1QJ07_9PEZI|nr:hypothetical protein CAC42_8139 [Sphaceloma murrayae]
MASPNDHLPVKRKSVDPTDNADSRAVKRHRPSSFKDSSAVGSSSRYKTDSPAFSLSQRPSATANRRSIDLTSPPRLLNYQTDDPDSAYKKLFETHDNRQTQTPTAVFQKSKVTHRGPFVEDDDTSDHDGHPHSAAPTVKVLTSSIPSRSHALEVQRSAIKQLQQGRLGSVNIKREDDRNSVISTPNILYDLTVSDDEISAHTPHTEKSAAFRPPPGDDNIDKKQPAQQKPKDIQAELRQSGPRIPISLRHDNPAIDTATVERHASAGATRSVVGTATKHGFEFQTAHQNRFKAKTGDGDHQFRNNDQSTKSIRRHAEEELANSSLESSDDAIVRASAPGTTIVKELSTQEYRQRMSRWSKPRENVDVDRYIAEGAKRGAQARTIAERLNAILEMRGQPKLMPKEVQSKAMNLTGIHIALHNHSRKPNKTFHKPASEATERDDDIGDLSAPVSPSRPKTVKQDSRKQPSRPTTGGKQPLPQWKRSYLSTLFADASDTDSDSDSDEPNLPREDRYQIYDDFKTGGTRLVRRPVRVYTVHKSAIRKAELNPDAGDAEEDWIKEREEVGLAMTDLEAAEQAAIAAVVLPTREFELKTTIVKGYPRRRLETSEVVVVVWIEAEDRYETDIRMEEGAKRREGTEYAIRETVRVEWNGEDVRETVSVTGRAVRAGEAGRTPEEDVGASSSEGRGEAAVEDPDMLDLLGEGRPAGDTKEKAVANAGEVASASARTPSSMLLSAEELRDRTYGSLEEANHVAARYVLEKMVLAFPPRLRNLDDLSAWKAQQTKTLLDLRDSATRDGEAFVQETVREAKKNDFPEPVGRSLPQEDVARALVVWKVEVVQRVHNGALN